MNCDWVKAIGNLNFGNNTESDSSVKVEFSALPMTSEKVGDAVTFCNNLAARIFVGELRSGPLVLNENENELWEMTGKTKFNKSGAVDYVGYLKTAKGGFIQAIGQAPSAR